MMVYGDNPDERVKTIPVEPAARQRFCLDDATILKLARWVMLIENYYSILYNRWCPVDVEWRWMALLRSCLFCRRDQRRCMHKKERAACRNTPLTPGKQGCC